MSASAVDYEKMFGSIREGVQTSAKCACVPCNACRCACSCRDISKTEDIEWQNIHNILSKCIYN